MRRKIRCDYSECMHVYVYTAQYVCMHVWAAVFQRVKRKSVLTHQFPLESHKSAVTSTFSAPLQTIM